MYKGRILAVALACAVTAACAVRLGGAKPEGYNVIGLRPDASASATDVASRIHSADANLVLLSANRDSTWFADVATKSGLTLNGPGHTGPSTLGFMTKLTVLGDTSLALPVTSGGKLHIQDALFKVDNNRKIDLILVSLADVTSVRDAVRAILNYIATDVDGTSAVVLGIDAPGKAASDSASVLLRAAFNNTLDCGNVPTKEPAGGLGINLYYGPEARLICSGSKIQTGNPNAVVARVIVER